MIYNTSPLDRLIKTIYVMWGIWGTTLKMGGIYASYP
jgi:hypothetical protein